MSKVGRGLVVVVLSTLAWLTLACTPSLSQEEQVKRVVAEVPWILEVMQSCEAYKKTKADAARTDIARETLNLIHRAKVDKATGKVAKLVAVGGSPGGAADPELSLQIDLGAKVVFSSQSGKRPIKKGGALYDVAGTLREGQCVTFAATDIEPIASYQVGQLCEYRYYAKLASLTPCP